MRISRVVLSISLCTILTLPGSSQAPSKPSMNDEASCRRFVEEFYAWYLHRVLKDRAGRGSDFVLREKSSALSGELQKLLKEDSTAQSKADEIVGLDFDPFLASQDPADRYVLGKVVPKGSRYWIDAYGVSDGKQRAQPDVLVELMRAEGRWIVVNFHYPRLGQKENLLAILKTLALKRNKQK